jgi:hypothetical protein
MPMPVQLFLVQCILWFVLTINQRAIAHVDYLQVIITDFLIASMNFFLVKKIADKDNDSYGTLAEYVGGGMIGSVFGMMISQQMLGK